MLVYAYEQGGATDGRARGRSRSSSRPGLQRLLPRCSPTATPPRGCSTLGYVAQALAMGATGAALLAHGPPLLAYALAAVGATCVTVTRPTQSALVPALAGRRTS